MKGARHAQDTLYDFIYMKFKDKQNESIMLEAKRIVTPGIGAVLTGKGHEVIFCSDGNVLYSHLCCG